MPDCARSAAGLGRVSAYTTTRNANHILQSRMYTAQIGPLGCAPTPGPKEQSLLRSKRLFTVWALTAGDMRGLSRSSGMGEGRVK